MRLRSGENEVNDKGERAGGTLPGGGGGTLSGMCSSNRVMSDVFSLLGFCDIAIDFRKFWSLIGNGLL